MTSEMGGRYCPITGKWEGHTGAPDAAAPKGTEIAQPRPGPFCWRGTAMRVMGNYVVVGHGGV